jgi:hypothetical protein
MTMRSVVENPMVDVKVNIVDKIVSNFGNVHVMRSLKIAFGN